MDQRDGEEQEEEEDSESGSGGGVRSSHGRGHRTFSRFLAGSREEDLWRLDNNVGRPAGGRASTYYLATICMHLLALPFVGCSIRWWK